MYISMSIIVLLTYWPTGRAIDPAPWGMIYSKIHFMRLSPAQYSLNSAESIVA